MIFGDSEDFAIEAEVEPFLASPSAVWGRMCVWCQGISLGNIEERSCALYPSYLGFAWCSSHLDELWDEELIGMSDPAALDYLDGLLYGDHGDVGLQDNRTVDEVRADWARYSKFNFLTNWGCNGSA